MGVVEVARDLALDRDVARKSAVHADPASAARLVREARLAARLEHPGIVPVYGAGTTDDGRPYYTMRLLRGPTLAEALARGPDLAGRLGLVRHVMDAAGAIAHAHRRRVFHRDLKPANIMVGEPGETVVTDWGLACTPEEAVAGGPVGTPGYMSPEQERDGVIDERSDVWGLGAVLHEVLTGEPPGDAPRERCLEAGAPPELAAVVARALADAPSDRYPDAAGLAGNLLAWFEGRRVDAHRYGAMELAALLVRRWRGPLVVAAVSAVALLASITVGWVQARHERDRAVAAESEARAATEEARKNLSDSLVGLALAASREGRGLDAVGFARRALDLAEAPDARGVLARFDGRPSPRLSSSAELNCREVALDGLGAEVACRRGQSASVYDTAGRLLRSMEGVGPGLGLSDGHLFYTWGERSWLWSGGSPRALEGGPFRTREVIPGPSPGLLAITTSSDLTALDARSGRSKHLAVCPRDARSGVGAARADGGWWAACASGSILRIAADGAERVIHRLPAEDGAPVVVVPAPDDPEAVAVGTARGLVVVLRDGRVEGSFDASPLHPTGLALRGSRVAAARGDGAILAWDLARGVALATLDVGRARLAWAADGTLVVATPTRVQRWELPIPTRPHVLDAGAGVSGIALSPDGARVAAGGGDGRVRVFDVVSGRQEATLSWQDGVAKDVAFSPDGAFMAAIAANDDAVPVWRVADWTVAWRIPAGKGRRIAWTGDGVIVAPYVPHASAWRGLVGTIVHPRGLLDLEADGSGAVGLDGDGDLVRIGRGVIASRPEAVAAAPAGEQVAVIEGDRWILLGADGRVETERPLGSAGLDVAVSGDQVAVAHLDGTITLWSRAGTLRARLSGHLGRVASLAFSADGGWLYSGSWDGTVRSWKVGEE
jgi:hypothetical protein